MSKYSSCCIPRWGTASLACTTGDCGGTVSCSLGGASPVTLAEFTLGDADGKDFYDVRKQEQVHQDQIPIPLQDLPRLQDGHLFIQSILDKLQCSYTLTGATTKSRRKAHAKAGGSSNHCSQGVGGGTMTHCTATWTSFDLLNVTVNPFSLVRLSDI